MAKALIDLNCKVWYTQSYYTNNAGVQKKLDELLDNSARICQIEDSEFDINTTSLLWVDCDDSVDIHTYYYDKSSSTIKLIPHASP